MALDCRCDIAATFPELGNTWEGLGIISATLRTNKAINIVDCGTGSKIVLEGPTRGDVSITAYAPLPAGEVLDCPGNASTSFSWDERLECDGFTTHFIPKNNTAAYIEGSVSSQISLTPIYTYETFNASAASGPHTPFLYLDHTDGYDLSYTGDPITISPSDALSPKSIGFLNQILPAGSVLYLTSFNWSYTPPNIPNVSYSFLFNLSI